MQKETLQQKLEKRKIKRPSAFIYLVLTYIWKLLYFKKLGVEVIPKINIKDYKDTPVIIVSNHASRLDYIYTGLPFLPQRLNFVAGYNEFFRSHLAGVFTILQVIPKRNFTPDIHTVREISRILKSGGKVVLYPEGMSSISGANQPCALGGGKLLKHFGVPVLMTKIKGGYLTSTKYNLDERAGHVEVTLDILFTPDELKKMDEGEIQEKLNEALKHDDYAWNKKKQYKYNSHGNIALGLETLLFQCPKCKSEFTMRAEKNKIWCEECGNGATLDECYNLTKFDDNCIIPETPRVWFDMERENIKELVKDKNYTLTQKVKLGVLPQYKYLKHEKTSEIVGDGIITLDRSGLTYKGTKENKEFSFHLDTKDVPTYGMCTDVSRFYTFYKGVFYEFYPEENTVEKWFMATEEMHRINGGAWQNFPDYQTRYDDEKEQLI